MTDIPKNYHPLWEKPSHHRNSTIKTDSVHWIELFYDLIHVVAIFLLGNYLSHHLTLSGFFVFTMLFLVFWMAWGDYAYYNSIYVTTDYFHRIISALHISTIMIMVATIPEIHTHGFVYFMVAYGFNRLIMALLYIRAGKYNKSDSGYIKEIVRYFIIMAIAIFITAMIGFKYGIFMLAIILFFQQLGYVSKNFGVMRHNSFTPRLHHISERHSLLLIICLGEGFFKLVQTLSMKGIGNVSPQIIFSVMSCGIGIFLLAWLYFDFVGNGVVKDSLTKTMAKWWYSHMTLMLAAVMIGVAVSANAKTELFELYPIKYALLGTLGLILYILSLSSIQSTIQRKYSHSFTSYSIRALGIIISLITLLLIYIGLPTIVGFIGYFLAIASQLFFPIYKGYKKDMSTKK